MTILRCAWHQPRKKWLRVAWWRGWTLQFTDGICGACRDRLLGDFRRTEKAR